MAEVKGEVEKKSITNKEMVNVPETIGNTLTASQTQELSDKGFLDILYEKITDVLGGDNPNQYLCLTLPGTIINPEKYKYDLSGVKPAHVKANESRLVNKLFDACFITGADNGKMLPNQYKTALSMLSPKLNKDLFELKNQLRKVLMTPYPYDFGEGVVYDLNVEQVFYRLYNDYVEEKAKWSKAQLAKKAELEDLIIDPVAREDKYLEWYGAVAESERVHLEEKRGRVLSVFSPDDMNIINAILNCGVGGEIEQARSTLDMVEELSPDGGYIYPVSLYPDNWFELLESSFTGMDLLESPAALSQKLRTLQLQRKNVLSQIGRLASTIPSDEKMKSTKEKFEKANQEYRKGVQNCTDTNLHVTKEVASAIVDLCMMDGEGNAMVPDQDAIERVTNKETKDGQKIKKSDIQAIIEKIGKNAIACSRAQTDAVAAGEECAKAAIEWCETKNQMQMKKLLLPLQSNLGSLNDEIEELKSQIQISRAANKPEEGGSSEEAIAADVMPNKSDDYFTQVIIDTTMSAVTSTSSKESSSSQSRTSASFFLGGYSSSESNSRNKESAYEEKSDMSIQIGMNVAKVQIERSWFNPGVFQLSRDMFNFSEQKIAPSANVPFGRENVEGIRKRFDEMNKCILPSFPVAFVIAKDVSIKFTSATSVSASFAETVESHASKGGGFLCFSTNGSSASSGSTSGAVANSSANSVTVRFTAPQILGYYMQAIPEDESSHINATNVKDISIVGFISSFKLMIDEYSKDMETEKKA